MCGINSAESDPVIRLRKNIQTGKLFNLQCTYYLSLHKTSRPSMTLSIT